MTQNIIFLFLLGIVLMAAIDKEKDLDLNFHQHDYHLAFERLELVRYNKDYIKEMSVVTFKYNRTQAVANVTMILTADFGNNLVLTVQAYSFLSNEYRLFPIRFSGSFCGGLAVNIAGTRRAFTCGNFTGCPLLKGKKQHICNFFPDEEHFPPFVPNGQYKVEARAEYFSNEVFVMNAYASVTRPIRW